MPPSEAEAQETQNDEVEVGTTETDEQLHAAEEHDPDHAPRAQQEQDAIVGSAGLGESQPIEPGSPSQDTPLVNAQSPQAQSGVALPEDRAAGVQPDPRFKGMVAPASPADHVRE
jgi:hypothetical protein